jgi:DNA polymerase delta subunit 2
LLERSPGIYAIGNQPVFASDLITSDQYGAEDEINGNDGRRTRVVLVPRFSTTGEVVFVHTGTLSVKTMRFGLAAGWAT